jgi:hypothetical protein
MTPPMAMTRTSRIAIARPINRAGSPARGADHARRGAHRTTKPYAAKRLRMISHTLRNL